jgi:GH15 family glucan-1,4-alpha-glucosidase
MTLSIEDYAIIGDCETGALVGRDGSIDWLCWPRFDSPACFAKLLGSEENGRWLIGPVGEEAKMSRAYRHNTLILETTIETSEGKAVIIDFMPTKIRGSHIVRLVRGLSGKLTLRTELIIRFDYGSFVPWLTRAEDTSLHAVAGPNRVVLQSNVKLQPCGLSHIAQFSVTEGETLDFTLSYAASYEMIPRPIDPEKALEMTERTWTTWTDVYQAASSWSDAVVRSLLTLRALIYQKSGGMIAAPTTSLPEQLGSTRNWDYRLCWLRDATFTLLALMNAGYLNEAKNWRNWLIRAIGGDASQVQILYGIGGERFVPETTLPWLPGYANSSPVRTGNAASTQLQLDIYGEVLDALYQARKHGLTLDDTDWTLQCELLKHLETIWHKPDDGIWELRSEPRQFTYSKVMCWVAFDRAIKSIEEFSLPGPLAHWQTIRQAIHESVCQNAYDCELQSFTQSYGSKELDASTLMIGLVGFLPPEDERLQTTLAAIMGRLSVDGLLRRYDTQTSLDGLPPGEGFFLACSFWVVDNLVLLGRAIEAQELFERLLKLRNELGLLSEQYDPKQNRLVGNFPQAFSHIALINSAFNLAHAKKPVKQRSGCKDKLGIDGGLA